MTLSTSLLFIPDISGYTQFVKSTEKAHAQQVIAELLEVLIEANTLDMKIAEVEGDAIFFYLENKVPSMERLLAQVEEMFTAFYSHLKMLESHRICPCQACKSATGLQLKTIAHCGDLEFIQVQGQRKPFGKEVIEAHRLLKNPVESNNYFLISEELAAGIMLPAEYQSQLFRFNRGATNYDGAELKYLYSIINRGHLMLRAINEPNIIHFDHEPDYSATFDFDIGAQDLFEIISNIQYRHHWVDGVDEFKYDPREVTRLGTEHMCVINHKHLNFITVSKRKKDIELIYGEMSRDTPIADELYTFYSIRETDESHSNVTFEVYMKSKTWYKRALSKLLFRPGLARTTKKAVASLKQFAQKKLLLTS